jgi:hypothetical protein
MAIDTRSCTCTKFRVLAALLLWSVPHAHTLAHDDIKTHTARLKERVPHTKESQIYNRSTRRYSNVHRIASLR